MRLTWERAGVLRITAHAYQVTTLVTAARYVVEAAPPELPDEALEQLRNVLDEYDTQLQRLPAHPPAGDPTPGPGGH